MGLFDKKICNICGEKIGLLGNRKLDDGNLCKDCAKKLSPWFEERRHSTVEDIKRQLEYREKNKKAENLVKSRLSALFVASLRGFEPPASWSRTKHSTKLSHTPKHFT